jgi:hypothetical protein
MSEQHEGDEVDRAPAEGGDDEVGQEPGADRPSPSSS